MAQAQPAPATPVPAAAASPAQDLLKAEQLDQLLAPIALYPDNLLAQTLMASTYPLEVVEASRWADENKNLKGDQLKTAVDGQTWDESVKSLVATPSVLSMMSTKLSWTQKLGDAVLAQQPDVMDSVQRLRARAQASKKLETTKEQKVSVKTEQNKQVIVIEPAQPDTVYVPYYNPSVVYGAWPYAAYPPYYFPPAPGYYAGAALATGLAFGAGVALGAWAARRLLGRQHAAGATTTSTSIARRTSTTSTSATDGTGSTTRNTARASATTTPTSPTNSARATRSAAAQARRTGWTSAAAVASRCSVPAAAVRAAARGRSRRPAARRGGGDRRREPAVAPASAPVQAVAAAIGRVPETVAAGSARLPAAGREPEPRWRARERNVQRRRWRPQRDGAEQSRPREPWRRWRRRATREAAVAVAVRAAAAVAAALRGGGGGGGRGGGGGGGRRSDISLKHDITLLGQLDNGLGFYRFSYNGSDKAYVGVMAQEVQVVMPDAVSRGRDGTLRVHYEMLGLKFQTYDQWIGSGARVPVTVRAH